MTDKVTKNPDAETDAPASTQTRNNESAPPSHPHSDNLASSTSEVDAKLDQLDRDLRTDIISTFQEFEKVLRRTRQELAQERFARREFEDTSVMRINQLQAMVDGLVPATRVPDSQQQRRRGPTQARRNERTERGRQIWEKMMLQD